MFRRNGEGWFQFQNSYLPVVMGNFSGKHDCWKGQGKKKKKKLQLRFVTMKINIRTEIIPPDSGSMGEKSMKCMYSLCLRCLHRPFILNLSSAAFHYCSTGLLLGASVLTFQQIGWLQTVKNCRSIFTLVQVRDLLTCLRTFAAISLLSLSCQATSLTLLHFTPSPTLHRPSN